MAGAYPGKIGGNCTTVDAYPNAHGIFFIFNCDTLKCLINIYCAVCIHLMCYPFLDNHLSTSLGAHEKVDEGIFSSSLR